MVEELGGLFALFILIVILIASIAMFYVKFKFYFVGSKAAQQYTSK